jgi:potassium/chloride transporter 9
VIIIVGELSVTFFGALLGMYSSAKLLQALARDNILPGLGIFGQGSKGADEPRYAILLTYAIAQVAMLSDLNQLASLVGMAILLTFLVTNLACFLLKVGSAPNFRPSYRYFSWQTALVGTLVSCAIMIYVNGEYSVGALIVMTILFLIIHYASPPKAWGDVSQSLIYHQVRKYLLRLRQDHVKSWRPSVLLVINDPRRSFKLIQFCNSLKKGALFMLGHVIVTEDFKAAAPEHKKQLSSWTKYIDISNIKAFINITVSPRVEWGIRNLVLTSGLGGMRPNIVVLGFFNLTDLRKMQPLITVPSPQPSQPVSRRNSSQKISSMWSKMKKSTLPTDADKQEKPITAGKYVTILEDLLHGIRINVAIAKGFEKLNLPEPEPSPYQKLQGWIYSIGKPKETTSLEFIDLWPIQMSSFTEVEAGEGQEKRSVLTSNFDTYTLILQLGAILESVPAWWLTHRLRISVFVEYEIEVEQERTRLKSLLGSLRIPGDVRVYWLAEGDLNTYEIIVNGSRGEDYNQTWTVIDNVLSDEPWWQELKDVRKDQVASTDLRELVDLDSAPLGTPNWRNMPLPKATGENSEVSMARLKKMLKKMKKNVGHLDKFHPAMRVKLSNLDQQLIDHYVAAGSDSENESSDEEDDVSTSTKVTGEIVQERRGDIQAVESYMSHPRRTAGFSRMGSSSTSPKPKAIHPDAAASETLLASERWQRGQSPSRGYTPSFGTPTSPMGSYLKPSISRNSSLPKFTSRPVPPTHIKHNNETGPSISFAEQHIEEDEPSSSRHFEIGSRSSTPPLEMGGTKTSTPPNASSDGLESSSGDPASGFPFMSSVPLSFNDLPSRAQNLILNELMVQHSSNAGVVFTTLPSPAEGTGENEEDSVRYLSDLEVLCQDLPPTLLVHCNTVTVTVSL